MSLIDFSKSEITFKVVYYGPAMKGFKIRLSLYTVPGQELYKLTRKSVLKSVDGIVFVADSNRDRREDNIKNLEDMVKNLADYELPDTPIIYQLNKRDTTPIMPVSELIDDLQLKGKPVYLGIASSGVSVMECLKGITREVVSKI
jgi:signal recognition particle receptor subunit beta